MIIEQSISIERKKPEPLPSCSAFIKKIPDIKLREKVADQTVLSYDRKKAIAKKIEHKEFSLGKLFGGKNVLEYYRVDTYQHATVSFKHEFRVTQFEYGHLDFTIKYSVAARKGDEVRLVEALAIRETPEKILADKLTEWIRKGTTDKYELLFTDFRKYAGFLGQYLATQAADIGLRLEATLGLIAVEGEDKGPTSNISITAKEVRVQPKGYNDFLNIDFNAVLIADKQLQSDTLTILGQKTSKDFQALLTKWAQELIRETLTYNDIATRLHYEVRTALIDYWNRQLRQQHKGWIIAELTLQSGDVPPADFKFERLDINVAIRKIQIPLIHTVILKLENAEQFKNQRIPNLETWIREKLQQVAQSVLTRISYAELVSRIDQLSSLIKSDLDKHALQIGYRVDYLLTSELIDKARLNFHFQFSEEEQEFETSLNDKVKLDVSISGDIISLDHNTWRSILTPETDFVLEMKKEVRRLIRQLLLRTHSDDFYTNFNEIVVPLLEKEIRALLEQHFNVAQSVDISPIMGDAPIIRLIKEIQRGYHKVPINCFGDAAVFNMTFSVSAVDRSLWSLFSSRNYTNAEEVKAAVGERIRIFIENAVQLTIAEINVLRDARLYGVIYKYAKNADRVVRDKMGLIIDIIDVEQVSNRLGDLVTQKNLAAAAGKITALMDAIEEVDKKITDGIIEGYDEWEMDTLTTRKAALQDQLDKEKFTNNPLSQLPAENKIQKLLDGGDSEAGT